MRGGSNTEELRSSDPGSVFMDQSSGVLGQSLWTMKSTPEHRGPGSVFMDHDVRQSSGISTGISIVQSNCFLIIIIIF